MNIVSNDEILNVATNNDELVSRIKGGDFYEEATAVLDFMQKRDYTLLDRQMDCAKDNNLKDMSFGRLALQIPQDHYDVLAMIYPDLKHIDAEVKTQAWKAFCLTDESLPYKVNKKQRRL